MRKTKPRFQLGFQPGIQLGSNLGSRLGIQLGFQPGIQTTGRNPAGIQTWDPAGIQTWDPAGIQTSDPAGIPSWDTAGNQTQGLSQTPTDSCSPLNWSKLGQAELGVFCTSSGGISATCCLPSSSSIPRVPRSRILPVSALVPVGAALDDMADL